MDSPVFIIGTERSGSNLVRLILNAHSRILVPHPPHVLHYLAPLEQSYGNLTRDADFRRLVDDVLRLVRAHIYPWEVELDPRTIVERARPRNLFGVFVALYDQALEASGKARWGCKSTFMIDHVDPLLEHFPDSRLIWLVRDPRDVAASSRKSVFSPFHPWLTAQLWRRQQTRGFELEEHLSEKTLLRLSYEELIARPEAVIRRLCGFLDEPFEDTMLRFFETREANRSGSLSEDWANTARPILSNNAGKFRRHLKPGEIASVEGVTGDLMTRLGYPPDDPAASAGEVSWPRLLGIHLRNGLWRLRVELRSLRRDRNHWRRWGRGLLVIALTVRRRLATALKRGGQP